MMDNRALLKQIDGGDHKAFAALYEAHRRPMIAYAAAILGGDRSSAEDAVDEAFTDIWKRAGSYNGQGSAGGWIRRIVRNKSIDLLRKTSGKEIGVSEGFLEAVADAEPGPEEQAIFGDQSAWLKRALLILNSDQRETVVLCYFNELSLQEIAETMNCPANTVKTRLHHARRKLHSWMESSNTASQGSHLQSVA